MANTPIAKKPKLPNHDLEVHSVAQVINPSNQFFGRMFQVGDVQNGIAHGFYLGANGRKEFVTASVTECTVIGRAFLGSRDPVSPQWKAEHP
jgi:hypothetical protein